MTFFVASETFFSDVHQCQVSAHSLSIKGVATKPNEQLSDFYPGFKIVVASLKEI